MIDHVSVAVRDLEAATRFYEAVLATLGFAKLEARPATVGFGKKYPEFWINLRDGSGAAAGKFRRACLFPRPQHRLGGCLPRRGAGGGRG